MGTGGDQRDRDRAKNLKKQQDANKGKSTSQKDKEAYLSFPSPLVFLLARVVGLMT